MEKYRLDYNKYKDRLILVYPTLSDEEREEVFYLRVEYWEMIIDFY